jgi:hypothetical protein
MPEVAFPLTPALVASDDPGELQYAIRFAIAAAGLDVMKHRIASMRDAVRVGPDGVAGLWLVLDLVRHEPAAGELDEADQAFAALANLATRTPDGTPTCPTCHRPLT